MQSVVPAVPIKLINQALLMAGVTSVRCGGVGCWGEAEEAWLEMAWRAELPAGHPQHQWVQSESPAWAASGRQEQGMQ